jgi:hypothetical protein
LKALLTQSQILFRPIHDLAVLLGLAIPVTPDLNTNCDRSLMLNDYAVEFRYPGESANKEEAQAAVGALRITRAFLRPKLGLS